MSRRARAGVGFAAVAIPAAVALGLLLWRLFDVGMSQTYDTMLYGRSLWGVAHGDGFNPVYGMHWLGIHANIVLLALAPFAWLVPTSLVLVVAQSLAFGVAVALLVRAAADAAGADPATKALAALWGLVAVAFSPLFVNPFLFDARPDLIAVPLLLAGLLRAERAGGWDGRAFAWLVAATLVREEFAIVAGASLLLTAPRAVDAGADAAPRWDLRRRIMATAALGAWFVAYWFVVRPALGEGFAADRADEAAADLFGRGGDAVARYRAQFAVAVLAFGGGLALRGWRWLGAALPGLAFVVATTKLAEHALNFHYAMFAAPGLAVAAVSGLRALSVAPARRRAGVLVLAIVVGLVATVTYGAHPAGRRFQAEYFATDADASAWIAECRALLDRIPADAGAAVPPMFGASYADRPVIWSLETLTRSMIDHGAVPEGVDWIAIDNNRFATVGRVLVNRHGFQLVGIAAGRIALFRRTPAPGDAPPILDSVRVDPTCSGPAVDWPEAGLRVCDVERVDGRLVARVVRTAAPAVPPLAIVAEIDGHPTILDIVGGMVDPATLPVGAAVRALSRDRFAGPRVRLHLQDMNGRNYMGALDGGPPSLGVELPLGRPVPVP